MSSIVDIGFSDVFSGGGDGDIFSGGDFEVQESVSFTDSVLSTVPSRDGGTQSLFSQATSFAKGLFGLADTGLELFGTLNTRAADVTGSPIFDTGRSAPPNPLSGTIGGVPLWLLVAGGAAAILIATR